MSSSGFRVAGVIPAFNEEKALHGTIMGLRMVRGVDELWVVDDGSTDGTARVASQCGARVTRLPRNVGKGRALDHAFRAIDADVYLLVDADLGEQVRCLEALLGPVLEAHADMTVASFRRPPGTRAKGGFGIVMAVARTGIRWLTGVSVREPLSGQRALNRRVVDAVCPLASGFGVEVALTVDALRAGLRVVEVDTALTAEPTGRTVGGFMHRGRQLIHVTQALFARARRR